MVNFKFGKIKKEEPEKVIENTQNNIKENQKLDSLQTELKASQIKITENEQKLKELNDKVEQLKTQQPASIQAQTTNSSVENKNDNQNTAALSGSLNKVNENGVWIVTGNVKDFKDAGNNTPKKGFYVIAGTFVYRDFAQSEVKRFNSAGYKQCSYLFSEPKQFNYVFILKAESKEEAVKFANQAKASGIKDAWVQQLTAE
jgi:mRNA-degrading endonuclease HigB of HigAB toxin-antitoxin module